MLKLFGLIALHLLLLINVSVHANTNSIMEREDALKTLEQLKIDVIALTRDVTLLKEQMTYPDQQKLSVYFSLTDTADFKLQELKLLVDEQVVKQTTFSERELALLEQGGAQRLFIGNIATGKHVITAFFTGVLNGQQYKRGVTANFNSSEQPLALALIIEPAANNRPVHFTLVEL